MKQSSVEWLEIELEKLWIKKYLSPITIKPLLDQAKAMHKEEIIKAVDVGFEEGSKFPEDIKLNNAEQYYKETFGGNK